MSRNIVVLSGSPRKGGSTDTLTAAFVEGAQSAGKSVSVFRTADMKINGCIGCSYCFHEQVSCAQFDDDMEQIWEALRNADAIVFASPVYFFSVSAQLKLAIDRTYSMPNVENSIKKTAMLLTCGDNSGKAAEGALFMHKRMVNHRNWDDAGVITAAGANNGLDDGRKELEQARSLGREI